MAWFSLVGYVSLRHLFLDIPYDTYHSIIDVLCHVWQLCSKYVFVNWLTNAQMHCESCFHPTFTFFFVQRKDILFVIIGTNQGYIILNEAPCFLHIQLPTKMTSNTFMRNHKLKLYGIISHEMIMILFLINIPMRKMVMLMFLICIHEIQIKNRENVCNDVELCKRLNILLYHKFTTHALPLKCVVYI